MGTGAIDAPTGEVHTSPVGGTPFHCLECWATFTPGHEPHQVVWRGLSVGYVHNDPDGQQCAWALGQRILAAAASGDRRLQALTGQLEIIEAA